jgi:hypothetical protein
MIMCAIVIYHIRSFGFLGDKVRMREVKVVVTYSGFVNNYFFSPI